MNSDYADFGKNSGEHKSRLPEPEPEPEPKYLNEVECENEVIQFKNNKMSRLYDLVGKQGAFEKNLKDQISKEDSIDKKIELAKNVITQIKNNRETANNLKQ